MKKIILSAILLVLASCSGSANTEYPEDPAIVRKNRAGKFFKDDLVLYGKKDHKISAKKITDDRKNPLWAASIQVISDLLPIATIDKNSGIIITEWYENGKDKSERIKINVLVKNNQPISENLIISLFQQKKDSKGNWLDEESNNSSTKLIREKILDKAKILAEK